MALLGKKNQDAAAPKAPKPPKAPKAKGGGLKIGRKKADVAAPVAAPAAGGGANFDDFSDFSDDAFASTPTNGASETHSHKPTKHKVKSGTVIGLNIGHDSIKAIEVRSKGGELTITGMGMVPTPGESISNGVVMSTGALVHALRDLFKQSKFRSSRVVSSVSGTGALVVRVLEVPRMSDSELADNMKVDADRYIPFPPTEVIMDFKALRELPSDPDSPNMEVLLAAAQREIIDLHIKVLTGAKLDPQSIDVEPLAAARALMHSGPNGNEPDYNEVVAVLNMGATGTEISVLRGDVLVFTRSIGLGGHSLTQAIVEYLGLPWHDAERLKREVGDALPPTSGSGAGAPVAASVGDWSDFGVGAEETNWDDFGGLTVDATPPPAAGAAPPPTAAATPPAAPPPSAAPAAPTAVDPFDEAFFQQGPRHSEPPEQHGQIAGDDPKPGEANFDFDNFSLDDTPAADTAAESTPPAGASPFDFSFPDSEPAAAPSVPSFQFGDPTAPAEPASADAGLEPLPDFSFDAASLDQPAPAAAEPAVPDIELAPIAAQFDAPSAAGNDALQFPDLDEPVSAAPANVEPVAEPVVSGSPSAYDLSGFESPASADLLPPVATEAPHADTATAELDDFDIDSLFAAGPASGGPAATALPDVMTPPATAAPPATSGLGELGDFSEDFADFGAGLADKQPLGIEAETVHSILKPLLEELANEVRRSLEYHASRYPDAQIRRIMVVGGGARLRNIDAFLTQSLGIPTAVSNPVARLPIQAPELPEGYAEENGPMFSVALGLALRDMI